MHVKLSPMLNAVKFLGPSLTKPSNMCFPEQWLNVVTLLVSCKIYLSSIASTFDDPMDVTELQIKLMSHLSQCNR